MKKNIYFLIFTIILLLNVLVSAQDTDEIKDDAEKIRETTAQLKEFTERDKSEFLAQQWKEFLLKNPYFATMDKILQKFSFVFFIFMGQPYEFNLSFLVSFFVWLFFLWILCDYVMSSILSRGIGIIVGFGITIILAQVRLFGFCSDIILSIVIWREGIWRWISPFIIFIFFIGILIAAIIFKKYNVQNKLLLEKAQEKGDRAAVREMAKIAKGEDVIGWKG